MSRGFTRTAAVRDINEVPRGAGLANAPHFKRLAVQHCYGLIAQIVKAEHCRPGITNGALEHAKAAMAALTGEQPSARTPIQWPPVVDEEE